MSGTHTFAEIEVSDLAYDEIAGKIKEAGYVNRFVDGAIDLQGFGLVRGGKAWTKAEVEEVQRDIGVIDKARWFVIFTRGRFAFRFGPFAGPEMGRILQRAHDEKLDFLITGDCGPELTPGDWAMMQGFKREMDESLAEGVKS
jgi:hypothetical protein